NDLGRVAKNFELPAVTLHLQPTASEESDLTKLLRDQQDPSSPNFHKWLTPEQYGERFGASDSDIQQIVGWLESQGLTVTDVARGRNRITVTGTAEKIGAAFGTEIHQYKVDGVTHYANATDPAIPAALSGLVTSVTGLHDFRLKPRLRKMAPQLSSGNVHNLAPDDIATIYNI